MTTVPLAITREQKEKMILALEEKYRSDYYPVLSLIDDIIC
jgi:hypothetical protein